MENQKLKSLLTNFEDVMSYTNENTPADQNYVLDRDDGGDGYFMLCFYDLNSDNHWVFEMYGNNPNVTGESFEDFKNRIPWTVLE